MGGPQPLDASRRPIVAWTISVLVLLGGVVVTLDHVIGPRPDATLQRTSGAPDAEAIRWAETAAPEMQIDISTLRPFEPFENWQVWSAVNAFGAPCLLAFESSRFRADCLPEPGDLLLTTWPNDLTDGGQIHFALRGETVDVFDYPAVWWG